jgi:hypothetical protein
VVGNRSPKPSTRVRFLPASPTVIKERKNIMGEMKRIDNSGDTKIKWDPKKRVEVKVAEASFNELTKEGYKAYAVKSDGSKGKEIKKFDPDEEKIIMVPPMVGG